MRFFSLKKMLNGISEKSSTSHYLYSLLSLSHLDESGVLLVVENLDAVNVAEDSEQREEVIAVGGLFVQVRHQEHAAGLQGGEPLDPVGCQASRRQPSCRQARSQDRRRKSKSGLSEGRTCHAAERISGQGRVSEGHRVGQSVQLISEDIVLKNIEALVSARQGRVGVVAALVVVVFDVQVGQLGVFDPEGAAAVVDVLAVQRELGRLGRHHVRILDEHLEGVVLRKGDDLQNFADPAEDLIDDVQGDRVHHVVDDDAQDSVGAAPRHDSRVLGSIDEPAGRHRRVSGSCQSLGGLKGSLGRGRSVRVSLVGLQLGVSGELNVDGPVSQGGRAVGEVVDHADGRILVLHFEESLKQKR